LNRLGDAKRDVGDERGALDAYEERANLARGLVTQLPGDADALRDTAINLEKLGDIKLSIGDEVGAQSAYQEILRLAERADSNNPNQAKLELARGLGKLGDMDFRNGDTDSAAAKYQQGLDIARKVLELDPSDIQAATFVVYLLIKTATVTSDPVPLLREALIVLQRLNPQKMTAPLSTVMSTLREQLGDDDSEKR
jgi:tetratricopeptide (TPR) repeat protein